MRRDESAVADVIGSGLLIGVTVITFVGLAILMSTLEAPDAQTNADLGLELDPGAGGWGTGDERILVRHRGGEALLDHESRIIFAIDGATESFTGSTLGSAYVDGAFVVGETWNVTRSISATSLVEVVVTNTVSDETLVTTLRVQLG